jgi:D-aminoacyl-tRNA deacylase
MRVVMQRVCAAEVIVDDVSIASIGPGLALLVGIARGDGPAQVHWMARKIAGLRVFDDATGPGRLSIVETGGALLAISQFTLVADCHKGRRPSYDRAMPSREAAVLFAQFVEALREQIASVVTGRFGATMRVRLVNEGPLTLVIDAPREAEQGRNSTR